MGRGGRSIERFPPRFKPATRMPMRLYKDGIFGLFVVCRCRPRLAARDGRQQALIARVTRTN
jgi:hypothetical protein